MNNEHDDDNELIQNLYDAVVDMDEDRVKEICRFVIENGIDAHYAMKSGMMAAMEKVGDLYSSGEYYVSELLLCADALRAGVAILAPHITEDGSERKKQLIIGTVEGDIHDVGKNIVKIMFEATGWVVHDLGKDVPARRFIEEQARTGADIIALSALMSSTMLAIGPTINAFKKEHPLVPVMVGGAPLTREIALSYGADGYADDAGEATAEAVKLLKSKLQ
jgi:methanogenic corrinoid protein MtbC1